MKSVACVLNRNQNTLNINPKKVAIFLCCIAGILLFINLIDLFNTYILGIPMTLIPALHLDDRNTIATYFLTMLHTLSSLLLGMIYIVKTKKHDPYSYYWLTFSIGLLLVSTDKIIIIHKRLENVFIGYWNVNGSYFLSLLILLITIAAVFLAIRFLLHFSSKDRTRLILAVLIFLSGAVGMNYLAGRYFSVDGMFSPRYGLLITIESGLEMLGSIVFIYSLLCYMSHDEINIIVSTNK